MIVSNEWMIADKFIYFLDKIELTKLPLDDSNGVPFDDEAFNKLCTKLGVDSEYL